MAALSPNHMDRKTQLNVEVENVPGKLAEVSEALAAAGVNVEGLCCTEIGVKATWHFVVDKADEAMKALASFKCSTDEILVYVCPADKPGVIAKMARACSNEGVNIKNLYSASAGKGQPATVFLSVAKSDLEKAAKACAGI